MGVTGRRKGKGLNSTGGTPSDYNHPVEDARTDAIARSPWQARQEQRRREVARRKSNLDRRRRERAEGKIQ